MKKGKNVEQSVVIIGTGEKVAGYSPAEGSLMEVRNSSGRLLTEVYVRDGSDSMLTVYSITGQIRFRKRILSSGLHEFLINLKKGVYVATLVSGKTWAAKRVIIN